MRTLRSKGAPAIVARDEQQQWLPIRAYNAVGRRVPALTTQLGSSADLVDSARRETGLEDFGDDLHAEGLAVFLESLENEARLTPAGRFFARGAVVSALANRLRVRHELVTRPEIAARPVGPALVVVGLPRSGTTLLQNLLSLDPANRSLRQWEAATPAPPPAADGGDHDQRLRQAERREWLIDRIAPSVRTLHPTGARLPTECVTLFANSLASLELGVVHQVPSYVRWCLQTDMGPHYRYYAQQLRVLAADHHRERWVLKCPAHLLWMTELFQAVPEARVVQLHRDPVAAIGSFGSLAALIAGISSDDVDFRALGALWTDVWVEGLSRAAASRRGAAPEQWVDLAYDNLVADPVAAVSSIYRSFGFIFTDDFAAAIAEHVRRHPAHGGRSHRYVPDDFGIDGATLRSRLNDLSIGAQA